MAEETVPDPNASPTDTCAQCGRTVTASDRVDAGDRCFCRGCYETLLQELRRGITAAQLALAWTLRDGGVIAIPKAVKTEHLRANLAAADVQLDRETLAAIDTAFPPPKHRQPLAVN